MVEEGRSDASTMLNIKSRSPRSLQARNTKNLSLNIKDNKIAVDSGVSNTKAKPVLISNGGGHIVSQQHVSKSSMSTSYKHSSLSPILKRNDSSIYSLPKCVSTPLYTAARKCHSNTNLSSLSSKNGQAPSLSLSVNTKELEPSAGARVRSQTVSSALMTSTPQPIEPSNQEKWAIPDQVRANEPQQDIYEMQKEFDENLDMSYSEVYKENAYPNGPLLVIPSNIFLYSEPTLEEVLNFDVVINVAKEIVNYKYLLPTGHELEYHHIPWTHNSKIAFDLNNLTSIMRRAVSKDKKVLIHCQCGVSRSASLVVAYIMRYYELNLNDAYNRLKRVAKDISPNMGLIFQLLEWNENFLKGNRTELFDCEDTISKCEEGIKDQQLVSDNYDVTSEPLEIPHSKASSRIGITLSPETTPQTPNDFFKNASSSSSSSSSSASTTSSTIVDNQEILKTIGLSPHLKGIISTPSDMAASNKGDIWR